MRYVLEGSVRRAGSRLRITAQLIDASTDDHLWADTYDGTVEDVFAIQERLARVIVDALELQLTADEERRLAERPIDNLHAYECYLRARQEGWRWRKDAIDHAIQLLHNGLAIVGDNAGLYAALGLAYLQYREAGIDFGEHPLREAEICARKVFALEPASASGLQLRGWIHYSRGQIQEAVRDLKAALDIDPNNADTLLLLSNCYLISGRVLDRAPAHRPPAGRRSADPGDPLHAGLGRCPGGQPRGGRRARTARCSRWIRPTRWRGCSMSGSWLLNRRADAAGAIVDAVPPEMRQSVPARIAFFLGHAIAGERAQAAAL